MRQVTLPLVAALLLAGCFGSEADTPQPAAALVEDDPAVAPFADVEPPAPVDVVVAYEGRTANFARVCPPTGGDCIGTAPTRPLASWIQEAPGIATRLAAEMTWEAASPLTREMGIMAMLCWEEEGSRACEPIVTAEGASPLAIEAAAFDVPDGAVLYIHAYALQGEFPGYHEFEQAFRIDGLVTLAPVSE